MFIYNFGIQLYSIAIKLAAVFKPKAKLFLEGRKNTFEDLEKFKKDHSSKVIWFHAASLGEFEQGLPVMKVMKEGFTDHSLVVSFFSPSGYEERKDHPVADHVCYLPLDTKANATRFLNLLQPEMVVFIKYEYWFHYLNECQKKSIPLFSISALFTPQHIFFKSYGGFHRKMLSFFDHTFVQNSKSKMLLESIGIDDVTVSGDTRFDRVAQTVSSPESFEVIKEFTSHHKTFIIGSAWPEDIRMLSNFLNQKPDDLRVIIAPHLLDKKNIREITKYLNSVFQLYSENKNELKEDLLILDTMGMLSQIYQYGDFAYIGGAFGDGLHNILEAVAFGKPVVFGNKGLDKFPEADELSQKGGAFIVEDTRSATRTLEDLMDDKFRNKASEVCKKYVKEKAGATDKIMSYLTEHLV